MRSRWRWLRSGGTGGPVGRYIVGWRARVDAGAERERRGEDNESQGRVRGVGFNTGTMAVA